eukprot:s444_g10.t1
MTTSSCEGKGKGMETCWFLSLSELCRAHGRLFSDLSPPGSDWRWGKVMASGARKATGLPHAHGPTSRALGDVKKSLAGPGGFVLPQAPLHTGLLPPGHTAPAMALNMAKSAAVGAGPPGKLVLLAPATKHITPVSSKTASTNNKKIAMEFVHASKDVQAQMLKDPTVARATPPATTVPPKDC